MAVTAFISFVSFFLIVRSVGGRSIDDARQECTAPYTLPNLPFFVAWNQPSSGCERHGIDLNLTAYGIVTNKNDSFTGDQMNIFYGIGPIPHYAGPNHTAVYGGLPQLGNLTQYLDEVEQNVKKYIPDPDFSGLLVMDWEVWRPHLPWNFGSLHIYVKKSMELVQQQYPNMTNEKLIEAEATRQFDNAAKAYMLRTVELIRSLRPNGHVGFYSYPRCWGLSYKYQCGPVTPYNNDGQLGLLFTITTGLFPRIYTRRNTPFEGRALFVRRIVNESLRIQVKWSGLNTPVMPYSLSQDNGTDFFQKEDLQIAITEPADMGASGVVIWGSSGYFHTRDECHLMQKDIKNVLGPFVKNLTDFVLSCARELCNFHGRCVNKEYEAQTQEFLRLYEKKSCVRPRKEYENISSRRQMHFGGKWYQTLKKYDNYICRCLAGWHGEYCEKPA